MQEVLRTSANKCFLQRYRKSGLVVAKPGWVLLNTAGCFPQELDMSTSRFTMHLAAGALFAFPLWSSASAEQALETVR
jgi:hypothetical protein